MIMKNVRLNLTENEKLTQDTLGIDHDYHSVNLAENNINDVITKENTRKFNSEIEHYHEQLEAKKQEIEKVQEEVAYDITKAEIKPMLSRILVKPFTKNPFQKMEVKNGLILSTGGYNPHIEKDPITGKMKEQEEFIKTGCVVEVGPEVKYLKEGDVVFYRKDTTVPVSFFTENLVSLAESQIIAVVNEGLQARFDNIKK